MKLSKNKINSFIAHHKLEIKHYKSDTDNGTQDTIAIYREDTKIGRCKFYELSTKNKLYYISRIDVSKHCRYQGYGSVLLYLTLLTIQSLGATECKLLSMPGNFSFYYKNGFCLNDIIDKHQKYSSTPVSTIDKNQWYQLSNEEKINITSKKFDLQDEEEEIFVKFELNNKQAIHIINKKMDDINPENKYKLSIHRFLSPLKNREVIAQLDIQDRWKSEIDPQVLSQPAKKSRTSY